FVVIDPSYGDKLYPSEHYSQVSGIENIWKPDFDRFPALKDVRGMHARLYPGDIVFVPSGWWHATRLPGLSIGTTCNSITRANWSRYQRFFLDQKAAAGVPLPKRAMWAAYLSMIAGTSRLHETFFGR
ncbi:MAG: cupin-like domain-containing protein, partial [Pseudomonadota bacterium]